MFRIRSFRKWTSYPVEVGLGSGLLHVGKCLLRRLQSRVRGDAGYVYRTVTVPRCQIVVSDRLDMHRSMACDSSRQQGHIVGAAGHGAVRIARPQSATRSSLHLWQSPLLWPEIFERLNNRPRPVRLFRIESTERRIRYPNDIHARADASS